MVRGEPQLTRRRLYLETTERILDRAEVVVLEDGAPLKWVERTEGGGGESPNSERTLETHPPHDRSLHCPARSAFLFSRSRWTGSSS